MSLPTVIILGAGPAGLGAAWRLRREDKAHVTVLEQRDAVGGNAGSFELEGIPVDYGSHRLHPACQPHILADLRALLKDDLLDRPRHGRIRLRGRWIHFPLKPLDLALRLPWSFGLGVARDALAKRFASTPPASDTFAGVLERGLGRTICRDFYFPYARKIWGLPPEELSPIQARRRVSAGSLARMVRKVLGVVPGLRAPGAGRFYYPRAGYGQISTVMADEARRLGAELRLGTTVRRIVIGPPHRVETECQGSVSLLDADHVWSTIPVTTLPRLISTAPAEAVEAAARLPSRAMILVYLVLGQRQFSEFDAHYFPEATVRLTRLSEPKNYSLRREPEDRTVLCGELPCSVDDPVWTATDDDLGDIVRESLATCGIPVTAPVLRVASRRLPHAYPIYRTGYESWFETLDRWVSGLAGVLSFGRQGLFAHDNTHHALAMAYAAEECLNRNGTFDTARWQTHRAEFATHVVED
ncbi:MAG: FAD-dependent oxidoreductase [Planctomycetes bacterium]|nr:FAD-dependent oxidoreductase [Planctomycetota bacterium]